MIDLSFYCNRRTDIIVSDWPSVLGVAVRKDVQLFMVHGQFSGPVMRYNIHHKRRSFS